MTRRVLMEGSHAIAEAAIQAGCRFYAGYPITPSTEILEYMSHRLPQVGGVCMNAESEIEAIDMVWGAAGCGVRAMIASTGQGISLMQESFAELANAQIPMVVVNMMRGQGDYFQSTRGGGHGDYRFIVLAPATVQEAVDLVGRRSTSPTSGATRSTSSATSSSATPPRWSSSAPRDEIRPAAEDLGDHRREGPPRAQRHAARVVARSCRSTVAATTRRSPPSTRRSPPPRCAAKTGLLDDADLAVVAFGSPARFVKYAVRICREQRHAGRLGAPDLALAVPVGGGGGRGGARAASLAVFELNAGQMIDDVRLAVLGRVPVHFIGGISHDHSGLRRRAGARARRHRRAHRVGLRGRRRPHDRR